MAREATLHIRGALAAFVGAKTEYMPTVHLHEIILHVCSCFMS
jgi:hypothetical protein